MEPVAHQLRRGFILGPTMFAKDRRCVRPIRKPGAGLIDGQMNVPIYVHASKEVGDVEHLEVFTAADAADRWFREHDPERASRSNNPVEEMNPFRQPGLSDVRFRFYSTDLISEGRRQLFAAPASRAEPGALKMHRIGHGT
jgi:hypothetical protein